MDHLEPEDPVSKSIDDFRRFITAIVAIFSLVFVTFGLYVYFTRENDQAQQDKTEAVVKQLEQAQNEVVQTRTESRKIQCNSDNDFKNAHNRGFQHVIDVFQSVATKTTSDASQEQVEHYLEIFKSDLVPLRDCSPQGIEDYYKKGG